jgi:RND family efflux transporter MFP subunit
MRNRKFRGVAFGVLFTGVAVVAGCGKPPAALAPPEAPPVAVQNPVMRPFQPTKEFTGRLVAKDPVKVIPQVSGMIVRRAFQEGHLVVKDETLLYEIDPLLYDADLKKAKADVAKAEADIKNWTAQITLAEIELERVKVLLRKVASAQTEVDKAVANRDVAKAQIDLSKANKEAAIASEAKAAENLRYCKILAPTTGRIGISRVADKSIVDAYRTDMVDVVPIDPIYAVFDVDELTSLWYRDRIYLTKEFPDPRQKDTPLHCWITLRNGRTYPPQGEPGQPVDYFDPEITRGTGTRTIRATFPNPGAVLSPGDSVRVRTEAGRPRPVLTVPETAVFAQQQKRYVYVLDGDEAKLREVEPGPAFDGFVSIERGLTTADRVIVDNLLRIRPGAKVRAQE